MIRLLQSETYSLKDVSVTTLRGVIMDIVVWLRSLGLERYEAVFRENEQWDRAPMFV